MKFRASVSNIIDCSNGFVKVGGGNLPKVCALMLIRFIAEDLRLNSVEISLWKLLDRSARESYGRSAIGYMQEKRQVSDIMVKGSCTPEQFRAQ